MITFATLLWDANAKSLSFSTMYDEEWVNKLYRGFARNTTRPFRFVCFTDRPRDFTRGVLQMGINSPFPDYGTCIEPYRLGRPMILVGLDTIITGNIDHLVDYCMTADRIALPKAVYRDDTVCNGVALVPSGFRSVYEQWRGENDMDWMRAQPHVRIDDLWPGHVVSYKGWVKRNGLGDARVVFFHGPEKQHELLHLNWVMENWK